MSDSDFRSPIEGEERITLTEEQIQHVYFLSLDDAKRITQIQYGKNTVGYQRWQMLAAR